jgi:glycolate oxidase FAD binding subunit
MREATRGGWSVLPAGLCTWLDGGGLPEVDLILSTRNLRKVVDYEPADLTFTAGAGIPIRGLQEVTREEGQWLPLDPPGGLRGSLGALAALGASGPLRLAYGSPRDQILGLTLVSGDGRILRWGGRVVKNVAGFDITRLSVGSWGVLGILTSVSGRLFPLPERDLTLLVPGASAEALLQLGRRMATSPVPFAAVELVDPVGRMRGAPRRRREYQGREEGMGNGGEGFSGVSGAERPEGAVLVLRAMGSESHVKAVESRARQAVSQEGAPWKAGELTRLEGEGSAAFHDALGSREEEGDLILRLSLLPSAMGSALEEIRRLEAFLAAEGLLVSAAETQPSVEDSDEGRRDQEDDGGSSIHLAAHVGWGVVRVVIPCLVREESALVNLLAPELSGLRRRLERAGGSLSLVRGPRRLLSEVGAWGKSGPEVALVRGIKKVFDPEGILAPGRFGI